MKKEKRDNYTFLTHAPVHHVIFTMAIPTIISMLSTSMYNLADTYSWAASTRRVWQR